MSENNQLSRQKTSYIKGLAQAIESREIDLEVLKTQSNDEIRKKLIELKGIGNWTIDVNALKRLKQLEPSTTKDQILEISEDWKSFRTIA